jgi:hypothetical protein
LASWRDSSARQDAKVAKIKRIEAEKIRIRGPGGTRSNHNLLQREPGRKWQHHIMRSKLEGKCEDLPCLETYQEAEKLPYPENISSFRVERTSVMPRPSLALMP